MHNNAQTHETNTNFNTCQVKLGALLEHPLAVTRIRRISTTLNIALTHRGSGGLEVLRIARILLLQPQQYLGIIAVRRRCNVAVIE